MNEREKIIFVLSIIMTLSIGFAVLSDMHPAPQSLKNVITGNTITRVQIMESAASNCTFSLMQGFNLVSFPCIGLIDELDLVLAPLTTTIITTNPLTNTTSNTTTTTYESVFQYDAVDANDPWKSYNPTLPPWVVQQISTMSRTSGYWIKMNASASYQLEGRAKVSNIPLYTGWNIIGYPSNENTTATVFLTGVSHSGMYSYDAQTDTWYTFIPGDPGNTLINMQTYHGYWINATATQTITVYP